MSLSTLPHLPTRILFAAVLTPTLPAAASTSALDRQFLKTVRPFITTYCIGCHSGATPAAQFDLKQFTSRAAVVKDFPHWMTVLDKLSAGQMPPAPIPAPPAEAKKQVMDWIEAVRS